MDFLLAVHFLLFKFKIRVLFLDCLRGLRLQLLQLHLVLRYSLRLLVYLALQHASNLQHIFIVFSDVLSRLPYVCFEILLTERSLLHEVVQVGDLVRLVLLLPLNEFVSH